MENNLPASPEAIALRILHLEDNSLDADLVQLTLKRGGISCCMDRVGTKPEFEAALREKEYDLILSDFSLPGFDGLSALDLAKLAAPNTPFVFLSGTIGEERAVESLKQGAADYVLKDRLQRLGSAILRARSDAVHHQQRIKSQEQIQRQAELLNQAKDAIFIRNLDQEITYWNKSAERIYGWTAEEITGKRASEILYRPGGQTREDIWKSVLEKGEWSGEVGQFTKSGKDIVVFSHRTLLRGSGGEPVGVLNINTDITEKKELENAVLRTQRMDSIGALAGGIAHDLNNMLAPILMATELLRSEIDDPAHLRMIETAAASAKRGADLVKQILQFSRGKARADGTINLRAIQEEMVALISKTFPRTITIKTEMDPDVWPVAGDTSQLHQIYLNLCVNARDAMEEGGRLLISLKNRRFAKYKVEGPEEYVSGAYVELMVSDTGPGIPAAIRERMFDPFFTTKAEGKGTGLGLSTVATIVRNHGGFMEVSSVLGKGAMFRVCFPAAKKAAGTTNESAEVGAPLGHGEWILLVEDELALLEMTKELLKAHNYSVLTAVNGAEALRQFEAHREKIAVVITDLLMPEVGGKELIGLITDRLPETRTICLSGSIDETKLLRKDQSGATTFLRKPCPINTLLATLEKLLRPAAESVRSRDDTSLNPAHENPIINQGNPSEE